MSIVIGVVIGITTRITIGITTNITTSITADITINTPSAIGGYIIMGKYDDIINMEYHKSTRRPNMSMEDRAAQFSPFKALTGLDEEVDEVARITDAMAILDDSSKNELDEKLGEILEIMERDKRPVPITITYFVPDLLKLGGEYIKVSGFIRRIDEYARQIIMRDGDIVNMDSIKNIEMNNGKGMDE